MTTDTPRARPVVAVIGGGVSGLTAAFLLKDADVAVTVLEGSPRLGGKLAVSEVGGMAVDSGAEALLARRPEGVGLIAELGLSGQLVQPGTTAAGIWTRGAIRPLPRRQFMGVPADIDELSSAGILSADGVDRARQDLTLPPTEPDGDVSVAERLGARYGLELVDRLVEPLLGGVYAGRTDDLSFNATLTPLAQAAHGRSSLTQAAASLLPPAPAPDARDSLGQDAVAADGRPSVFTTLAGGLGIVPGALAAASDANVRIKSMVRELVRTATGWRLTIGSAHAPEAMDADAVIIAVPATPASRLLAATTSTGASELSEIKHASMAIVTLAYPPNAFPAPVTGSGFLVPAVDGRTIKAVTVSTNKWPHLRPTAGDLHIVRCSVGRFGEQAVLQRDDSELVALAAADLASATGVIDKPVDARVSRWGGGLPQYSVGHLERVARIRAAIADQPGLAVCGAAYDGVGIPACIATARLAVDQVLAHLAGRMPGQ